MSEDINKKSNSSNFKPFPVKGSTLFKKYKEEVRKITKNSDKERESSVVGDKEFHMTFNM